MVRFVDRGVVWHARIGAPENGRPARRIITGRRRRVTGYVPSRKAGSPGLVLWESELERDCVVLVEFRPSVLAIVAQPHTVEVWTDGASLEHTPDYLLGLGPTAESDEVVEVKPVARALRPETERRLRISAAAHRALGFSSSVLCESEIRTRPRLANASLLLRYQLAAVREGLAHRIATLLAGAGGGLSIRECVRGVDGSASTRFEIYALACRGFVELDLTVPSGSDQGGRALVWDMPEDLEDLASRAALLQGHAVKVSEVKSQHGRLAVSYHGAPPWGPGVLARLKGMQAVVAVAEERASCTCERCGRPGATALHAGWWFTLCLEHHAAEERGR